MPKQRQEPAPGHFWSISKRHCRTRIHFAKRGSFLPRVSALKAQGGFTHLTDTVLCCFLPYWLRVTDRNSRPEHFHYSKYSSNCCHTLKSGHVRCKRARPLHPKKQTLTSPNHCIHLDGLRMAIGPFSVRMQAASSSMEVYSDKAP